MLYYLSPTWSCTCCVHIWSIHINTPDNDCTPHVAQLASQEYTKVGNTTLSATSPNSSSLYELAVRPSLPFQRGDVLGIFQPHGQLSRLRIYYRTGSGNPLNFVFRPPAASSVTEPPLEGFTTMGSGITLQTVLPLVTVEICKPCLSLLD